MVVAFGVDRDGNGTGLDALTLRRIIKGKWTNTGITTGLAVSGRSNLQYAVSAGMAVCSMSDADGYTEAYYPGGVTENAVSAADATYARIDTVYMLANTGSPDNLIHVDVKQGTPSATPVAPSLPSGATALRRMKLPAGATTTAAASPVDSADYAIPYGVSLGRLANSKVTADYTVQEDNKWHQQVAVSFTLPTDRLLRFTWKAACTTGPGRDTDRNDSMGSYFLQLRLDGNAINDTTTDSTATGLAGQKCDEILVTRYRSPTSLSYEVSVAKGSHSLAAWAFGNKGWGTWPTRFVNSRELTVTDMGVSR
jgi:hypothetical protein